MIKFFEGDEVCDIVIDPPMLLDDIDYLKSLLNANYIEYRITFGRIYSLNQKVTTLLYDKIFNNKKKITITTHKNKLNRYLSRLGFKSSFVSLIKDEIVDVQNIKVILIGGSANSSSKIINIIKSISLHNLTLVVVQHVDPKKDGLFDEILQPYTQHKIEYARDIHKLEKSKIYLAPADKHLKIENGRFSLTQEKKHNYSRPSISLSYESFSSQYKESFLAIQECGYSNDGVDALSLLKKNGSIIIIQDPKECEATSMIDKAIAKKTHNYILDEKSIIDYINFLDKKLSLEDWIIYLLDMILERYHYDFRLYQRDMVSRRLEIFMIKHDVKEIKNAVGVILFNKSAFKAFFLELSINVTEFFRDPNSFKSIIKLMDKAYNHSRSIKIWSAGCSSGKEAYSLSIILSHLGILDRSIIYATDFNSVVLDEAKAAIYPKSSYDIALENFKHVGLNDSLDNYVMKNSNFVAINDNIAQKVLFLQHNLVTDSSFNEFNIIICKNVIIYFNDNLQERVFKLIYDSLKFGGHLILGESEMIHLSFRDKFRSFDEKSKIYQKIL